MGLLKAWLIKLAIFRNSKQVYNNKNNLYKSNKLLHGQQKCFRFDNVMCVSVITSVLM